MIDKLSETILSEAGIVSLILAAALFFTIRYFLKREDRYEVKLDLRDDQIAAALVRLQELTAVTAAAMQSLTASLEVIKERVRK